MPQKVLFAILLISLHIIPEISGQTYLFHLPWACAVLFRAAPGPWKLIGACAIFNRAHVLVSVDNFNKRPTSSDLPYYQQLDKISVFAGSNYMNGSKSSYAQVKTVDNLFIGRTKHFDVSENAYIWDAYISKPISLDEMMEVQKDAYGVSFNVGILKIKPTFVWTGYVHPITMNFLRLAGDFPSFEKLLEHENPPKTKCITYSWNEKENKIRYHEVMYLPRKNCLELFCAWDLMECNAFPNQTYQFCFKASKFVDVCPNARGAALYCPSFAEHSVFAILTTAPSCGLRQMPGVYTTLPLVIRLYETIYSVDLMTEGRPDIDDPFTLDQKNVDYEGVLP